MEFSAIVKFSGGGRNFNTARAVKFKRDKIWAMKFNELRSEELVALNLI